MLPALPAVALTSLPLLPTLDLPAPQQPPCYLVMPLPHCAEGSAKAKPELGTLCVFSFLPTSILTTGLGSQLA